jgi:hypothetical protein
MRPAISARWPFARGPFVGPKVSRLERHVQVKGLSEKISTHREIQASATVKKGVVIIQPKELP